MAKGKIKNETKGGEKRAELDGKKGDLSGTGTLEWPK